MSINENNLVWIDLEMTGLNPERDHILEIASVITDSDLNVLAEGPTFAIHQSEDILNLMDSWNVEHHTQSGLVDRVQTSNISETEAEQATLHFLKEYVPGGKSPICGNSIHQDRRFLTRYMPTLESFFHYRNLDVSTLKILAERWAPDVAAGTSKVSQHIALQDIHDSINELRYYRQHLLKGG